MNTLLPTNALELKAAQSELLDTHTPSNDDMLKIWNDNSDSVRPAEQWNAPLDQRLDNRSKVMQAALTDDPYTLFPRESVPSLASLANESPEQRQKTDILAMKYASAQYLANLYKIPFEQAVTSYDRLSELYFGEKNLNPQQIYLKLRDQVKAGQMPGWWQRRGYDVAIGSTSAAKGLADLSNVLLVRPIAEMASTFSQVTYGSLELASRALGFRNTADWFKSLADQKRNPVHSLAENVEAFSRSRAENIDVLSEKQGSPDSFSEQVASGVVQNLPELMLTLAFAEFKFASLAANSLYYGLSSFSSEIEDTRYDSNMSEWQKIANAVAVGTAETIFEQKLGLGRIAGKYFAKPAEDEVRRVSQSFFSAASKALKSLGSDAAGEGTEEILTGITQRFSNLLFHKDGKDLAKMSRADIFHEICDPVPVEGSVGALLGGTMASAGLSEKYRIFKNQAAYQNFRADMIGAAKEQLSQLLQKENLSEQEARLAEKLQSAVAAQNVDQTGGLIDIAQELTLNGLRSRAETEADDALSEFEYGKKLEAEAQRELAAIDADSRARAEVDSSAVRSEFNAARAKFDPNLDIQLIDSASLPEHLRSLVEKRPSAEGLWNNGSIYLLEDRISPGRVRKVLLHEVVAHEGLRRVFGKDYDTFLRQIVNQYADPISSLAARRHIDITTPAGQLEAADEFLAELAESRLAPDSPVSAPAASDSSRAPQGAAQLASDKSALSNPSAISRTGRGSGSTAASGGSALSSGSAATLAEPNGRHLQGGSAADTFERPWGATLRSALRSVLSSLRAFLRRHGWNLAWTDNDLSALLARSARSVSAQSASAPSARSNPSDPRFSNDLDVSQAFPEPIAQNATREDIESKLESLDKKDLTNRDTGTVAQINGNQRRKIVSDAAVQKSKNNGFTEAEHFQTAANIEALYENAVLLHSGPDTKNHDPFVMIHRFGAPIVLDGKIADAILVLKESVNKENCTRLYALELEGIIQKIEDGSEVRPGFRTPWDNITHEYFPEGIHKLQLKHEKVKHALEFFNENSSVVPSPGADAPLSGSSRAQSPAPRSGSTAASGGSALSSGSAATLAEPNGRHLQGGSAADTFERPTDATLPQSGPVRFSDDPSYEAKAAAIAKILYRCTGTSYLVEPEEAASILAKGGWRLDPVNDEELLRYSAALAVKMKRERALKARHERERNAIRNADEWTKLLMEKYGENFKINPGPKYDGSHEPFTGTWIDHRKTEKARAASSIPAEEAAKFLTEKTGQEVSPDMVVSHYADLKREGLLSAYREKRRKKSELYEIENVIEEDERLNSGAEPLSTEPIEESEYKKKLRQKFQKEAAEKEQIEIDRWLYDNVQEWHWIADALGGLNLRFGFTLRPAARFAGEDFTGSFISPDWRRWSEYRPGKRTGKALADYKALREKHLKDAPGKHSDELAKEIAAKTGGDELEIEQKIIDFLRDLKRDDLRNMYYEAKRSQKESESRENEEFERQQGAEAAAEHYKALLELAKNDRVNIIQIQSSAAAYARKHLPLEMRGAFLSRIAALSKFDSERSPKYPEGRRAHELEKLLSDMQTYRIRDQIRGLLDGTRARVRNGRPVQPLGENKETVDLIRTIVQTPAYDVENKLAHLKEQQNAALNHVDESGNLVPQQAEADKLAEQILLWDLFGSLDLRTKEQNLDALKTLRNLIDNDRTGLLAKLRRKRNELDELRHRAKQEITGEEIPRIGRRVEEPAQQPWKYTLMNNSLRTIIELVTSKSNKDSDQTVLGELYSKLEDATQRGTTLDRETSEASIAEINRIFGLDNMFKRSAFWKDAETVVEHSGVFVTRYENPKTDFVNPETGEEGYSISDRRSSRKGYITVKNARILLKNVAAGKAELPSLSVEFLRQQLSDYDLGIERVYDIFHNPDEDAAFQTFAEDGRVPKDRRKKMSREALESETKLVLLSPGGREVASTVELPLSKADAANILMQWEQKDVRARMEWNGWSQDSIDQLKKFIGPKMIEMAYWMRSKIAETGKLVDSEARELYGCGLPKIQNYFPSSYNESIGKQLKSDPLLGDSFGQLDVNPTFLIARKFHLSDIDIHRSIFQTYFRHQTEAHHFLAYGRVIREARGIVSDPEVRAAIRSRFGTNTYNALVDRIDLIANGGRTKCEAAAWLGKLFRYWTPAKIAVNSSSILKQIAGAVAYATEIPLKDFAAGVADAASISNDFKRFCEYAKNSDYIKNRFAGGVNSEVMYLMQSTRSGKIDDAFGNALIDKGTYLTRWSDKLASIHAGYAVFRYHYRQALASGRPDTEAWDLAVKKWQRATDETQQSGYLKDQNYFQSSSIYYKYFTAFLSNPIQIMNLELMHINNLRYGSGKRKEEAGKKLLRSILVNHVIVPTLMTGITQALRNGFNLEDWEWEDFLTAFLLGPFEGAFIAGKVFTALAGEISMIARRKSDFGGATFNAFPQLDDALGSLPKIVKLFRKDNPAPLDYMNAIQGGAELVSAAGITPVPFLGASGGMLSGLMREIKRWYRLLSDE